MKINAIAVLLIVFLVLFSMASVGSALELDNGGLEMTDELPQFGDPQMYSGVTEFGELDDIGWAVE